MADLSTLCPACTQALHPEDGSNSKLRNDVFENHHPSRVSFLNAVKYGCFICRIVWENVDSQGLMMQSESHTQHTSTSLRLYKRTDERGLRLVIAFRCHSRKMALETKFQLLPSNGKCRGRREASGTEAIRTTYNKNLIHDLRFCSPYEQALLPLSSVTTGNFVFNHFGFGFPLVSVLSY